MSHFSLCSQSAVGQHASSAPAPVASGCAAVPTHAPTGLAPATAAPLLSVMSPGPAATTAAPVAVSVSLADSGCSVLHCPCRIPYPVSLQLADTSSNPATCASCDHRISHHECYQGTSAGWPVPAGAAPVATAPGECVTPPRLGSYRQHAASTPRHVDTSTPRHVDTDPVNRPPVNISRNSTQAPSAARQVETEGLTNVGIPQGVGSDSESAPPDAAEAEARRSLGVYKTVGAARKVALRSSGIFRSRAGSRNKYFCSEASCATTRWVSASKTDEWRVYERGVCVHPPQSEASFGNHVVFPLKFRSTWMLWRF